MILTLFTSLKSSQRTLQRLKLKKNICLVGNKIVCWFDRYIIYGMQYFCLLPLLLSAAAAATTAVARLSNLLLFQWEHESETKDPLVPRKRRVLD